MNNERYNQIIDEAYKNYRLERNFQINQGVDILSQEEFINKIKTDVEFSEKWGLKIEERILSTEERNQWFHINWSANNPLMKSDWKFYELDQQNVPTKLITVTYKKEKIEIYG
jgi:hypothetical protein